MTYEIPLIILLLIQAMVYIYMEKQLNEIKRLLSRL